MPGRLAKCVMVIWVLLCPLRAAAGALDDLEAGNEAHQRGATMEALEFWEKSAKAGNSGAAFNLGVVYQYGKGVRKKYAQALHWYRRAARQGQMAAANNLGNMYRDGLGVVHDEAEEVLWYRKGANGGHKISQFNLARMYENGFGVRRDRDEAIYWYRKASDQGYRMAKLRLRKMGVWNAGQVAGGSSIASDAEKKVLIKSDGYVYELRRGMQKLSIK